MLRLMDQFTVTLLIEICSSSQQIPSILNAPSCIKKMAFIPKRYYVFSGSHNLSTYKKVIMKISPFFHK